MTIRHETAMESLKADLEYIKKKKRRKMVRIDYVIEMIEAKYFIIEQNQLKNK